MNNPLNQTDFKHTCRRARAHTCRHPLSSTKDALTLNGLSVIEFPDVNGIRCFLSPWTHQGRAWETEQKKTERRQISATGTQSKVLIFWCWNVKERQETRRTKSLHENIFQNFSFNPLPPHPQHNHVLSMKWFKGSTFRRDCWLIFPIVWWPLAMWAMFYFLPSFAILAGDHFKEEAQIIMKMCLANRLKSHPQISDRPSLMMHPLSQAGRELIDKSI